MIVGTMLINSLVWAGELGLIAIGMSMSYSLLRFANFTHAEFVTVGGYLTYLFYIQYGIPLPIAITFAVLLTGACAILVDFGVFSHIRRASPAAKMVLSVGLAMIIRSVIAIVFGSSALTLGYLARPIPKMLELFRLRATDLQIAIFAITMVSMILFSLLLQRTKLGKALRATADNPSLAEAKGINTASVIRWMWFISGGFAALGGCLIGLETQLRPGLGMYVLMPMFAAATVGGLGSPYGAVAGALLIAVAQNFSLGIDFGKLLGLDTWRIGTGYKSGIALLALVGTLLVRPRGIFGKRGG